MNIPSHYKLVSEHPDHYEIHDERDGKNFPIAKRHLSLAMHGKLSEIQKFSKGGKALPEVPEAFRGERIPEIEAKEENAPFQLGKIPGVPLQGLTADQIPQADFNTESKAVEQVAEEKKSKETPVIKSEEPKKETPSEEGKKESATQSESPQYLNQELKSIQGGVNALKTQGENTADAYETAEDQISELPTTQEIWIANKAKNDELYNAFASQKINPTRVIDEMSTGDKFLTSIGMLFGGAGAGRYGTNNGINMLNDAIERDIDAQKNEQNKRYTMWQMNLTATRNEVEATEATRAQYLTLAQVMAEKEAAKAIGPLAKAQWAEKIAAIQKEKEDAIELKSLLQSARSTQFLPEDPTMYVNKIKDEHARNEAKKEIEDMKIAKRLQLHVLENIDKAAALPWIQRSEKTSSKYASYKKSAVGTLAKYLEGTYTESQSKDMAESFFNDMVGSSSTAEEKRKQFSDLIGSKQKGVFFQSGTKVPLEKFEMTSLSHVPPSSRQTAQTVQNKSDMMNDRKYFEKYKNSNDPKKRQLVEMLKRKYGFQ